MANNTTTFTLKLKTEGLDQAQQQTQIIRENLEGAQRASSGTAGSRRFASSGSARGTGMAGQSAGVPQGQDVDAYNRLRGAAGASGARGRDFSDQARGLGGLVRLYATVAANTFALTAAFGALSRAMDTTNMVKGLDQLGSASGVALGTLSKRLVQATDGAISLREAMEATTKAVSSGMKSDDVLRLGNVAKQASQALGLDMGDAVSRLTRGITKLEPELLDELGIFTKIEPAIKEYAKSVNKSTSELTDFERRAAFANAVLAEGEQKFSSIKLDANPYTKLRAAIANTGQQILEFVNKVIAPVANFFSQSPTALITGITALAAVLLKQALPAIGEFKQGLEQTAQRAQQLAQQKAQDAVKARQLLDRQIIAQVESRADKELKAVETAEARIQQLQQGNINKRTAAYRLLSKDLQDVQEKDLQRVSKIATSMESKGKVTEAQAYRDVVSAIRAQQKAEEDLVRVKKQATEQVEKDAKSVGTYGLTLKAGEKAQAAATRSAIISNAAYNGSLIGIVGSLRLLREEIAKNNITGLSAAMLTARGAIAAIGGAISTALSALNGFFMIIGLITAAVSLLDGIFSKASKEITAFDDSVIRVQSSTKNLSDTFDTIYKTNPFSVQSLEAQGNALLEFSSSMDELTKNALKALRALEDSGWDNFKNRIKSIFGYDVQSVFTENFGKGISEAVKGIDNKKISDDLKSKLGSILKVEDVTNVEQLEKALAGLKPSSAIIEEIKRAIKAASSEAGIAASKAREFVSAFDASKESFREVSKQFEINDPVTKWAKTAISALTALNIELKGTISESIASLVKVSAELDKSPIFGSSSLSVAKLNTQLVKAQNLMIQGEQDAQKLEQTLKDLEKLNVLKAGEQLSGKANLSRSESESIVNAEINRLKSEINNARAVRREAEATAEKLAIKIKSSINTGLTDSISIVSKNLQAALAKGSTQLLQSLYSRIDVIPELAQKQYDLKIKELDIEASLIKSQQDLANRIVILTAEIAVSNAIEANKAAKESLSTARTDTQLSVANQAVSTTAKDLKAAEEKLKLLKKAATDPIGTLRDLNSALAANSETARSYSKEVVDAANSNTGFLKSLRDIADQQKLIKLVEKPLAAEEASNKQQKESLDARIRANSTARDSLQLQLQTNKGTEIEVLENLRLLQLEQSSLELEDKKLKYTSEYNKQVIVGNALAQLGQAQDAEKVYQYAEFLRNQEKELSAKEYIVKQSQIESNIVKERLAIYDKQQAKLKEINDAEAQNIQTRRTALYSVQEAELSLAETRLSLLEQQGILSQEESAREKAKLELAKQNLSFERERQVLQDQRSAAVAELAAKANRQAMGGEDNSATLQQMINLAQTFDIQAIALDKINQSRREAIRLTEEQAIKQAKLNDVLGSLAAVFGEVGVATGNFLQALQQVGLAQEKNKKTEEDLRKKQTGYEMAGNYEKVYEIQEEINNQKKQSVKDEISGNAKILGSAKGLFKEKTFAYKALSGLEKAMHLARLAMDVKEMISGGTLTLASIGQSMAKAGAAGLEAIVKAYTLPPPLGFVTGAAMTAIIGSLLGKAFGGGKSVSTVGMTAKDRQETQGTGMAWINGQKVATGGGVFGDSEAKSNSIRNSLEVISATSVEGLTYQDKTVKLLASINAGITGVAQNAYGVVGLRTGSAFGTQEGSGGRMVLGGLFGSTTSTQILDTGIALKGTFDQLAKGGKDLVQIYETVKTSSTSSFLWVKKTRESVNTNIKNADSKIAEGITEVFSNAASLFVENGVKLGMTAEQVFAKLAQISTDQLISLKDLKGDELEKELNAVISSILDTAATSVFESLKQYQKFGEGMLETAVRVIDSNQKVNLALKSTSMVLLNIGEVLTEGSIKASEALVAAAGGLDKFLEQSKFFADNFLTEAERLAPVQADLTKRLVALGLGTVDTKDKFKLLVQGLDLAKEADQALYQSLMELAPAFNMVYKESQQLLSVEELKSKVYDQETKVLELLGKKQELLARARAKELDEMRKYPKQQADILIANQEYIYALEDEATARENLKKRVDDTISGLKTAIQNITQYRTQLTMSDKTVLTPAEQYKQAQEEFEKLKTTAVGPAATEADRALQLEAINKLPQAADTFLNLSRTMYASGSQYQTDFASVLSTLDTVGVSAQTQLTTAEQQLTELKQSSYYLEDIALSSKSTKELLEEWRNAADRAQTASSGFTPVNMLVNTVSPNADVVQEVAKLREEFTKQFEKLREEQAQQAAAAIVNNTVVNDNAANKIVDALEQDSGSTWNDRVTADNP